MTWAISPWFRALARGIAFNLKTRCSADPACGVGRCRSRVGDRRYEGRMSHHYPARRLVKHC